MVSRGSSGGGSDARRKVFLVISTLMLSIGTTGGPLMMRLYFIHGGKRVWLSSWLETGGWPVMIIPIAIDYFHRRTTGGPTTKVITMKPHVFAMTAVIGVLTGLDDYLYAYALARLPISTSALITASHLGFTATFAFLLVRQKFTSYSINAVFLLTIGAGILAMHTRGDRLHGESSREYYTGFFMLLGATSLYGLVLPLIELMYKKAKQAITYSLVLEVQLVMCFFATLFCTIGTITSGDFQALPEEARNYSLGEVRYWAVMVCTAIIWQFFFLGAVGVIHLSSSLFSGIVMAALLPVTEILAVVFYREKFPFEKALSLILSLWGFLSYFYGEIKESKKQIESGEATVSREDESQGPGIQ
ncbi:hypothetical protein MLD38_024287 [Melastoma candidum]|uniref:Uncharacterized protein n=1 Tax=Melastoma candidum TaxID=119954 RepID=A0ACB9NWU7_9MYRT|nr:hypothetical protein MLD38_024287 [Melastoma candidum]